MAHRQPSQQGDRPLILLIENDEADVFLFRRALSKLEYRGEVRVVGSVSEARSYMENSGQFKNASYFRRPALIVADFSLSGATALEFIRWLRNEEQDAELPVVILSGTLRASDVPQLSSAGVQNLIQKTADLLALAEKLRPLLPVVCASFLQGVFLCAA